MKEQPIKGWVKARSDNLPKSENKNIVIRFLGNVYYGKYIDTNGDVELHIPGLKGMYPKDAWEESEWLDETPTPIQSGEERLLREALENLLEAIPKQTNDADWWPDELTKAVKNAKLALDQKQ